MPSHLEVPVPPDTLSSWSRGSLQQKLQHASFNISEAREIWGSLLRSLETPTISEKQITHTCNCVRIFLKGTSSAQSFEVRNLPLLREEWIRCYDATCYSWNRAKIKPLAQVLEALLQIAKCGMPKLELEYIWRSISSELSAIVLSGQPARDLKKALALSSFFLENKMPYPIYLESVRQNMEMLKTPVVHGNPTDADTRTSLIHAVLSSFQRQDAQSSAEKCFKSLLKANIEQGSDTQSWWPLVKSFVADRADSLDPIANSVFPILLEQHSEGHLAMIESQGAPEDKKDFLFPLALLQSLRERDAISQDYLLGRLQEILFGKRPGTPDAVAFFLTHADDSVRVRTLRLLTTSKMTNAPISSPILLHLKPTIGLWFRPGGPYERGETLSIIKKLLIRLRGGSSSLEKTASSSPSDLELLDIHRCFMQTLVEHVTNEISPNASYQRRAMGLTVLSYFLEARLDTCDRGPIQRLVEGGRAGTGTVISNRGVHKSSNHPDWSFSICLRQSIHAQNLLNLLSDAYEDVRMLCASILRHLLVSGSRVSRSKNFSEQLQAAMELSVPKLEFQASQTNRSDHADGLGRLYALLYLKPDGIYSALGSPGGEEDTVMVSLLNRLEIMLNETSAFHKPGCLPLHGSLLGLMYCTAENSIPKLHSRIIVICRRVWDAVIDRLCIDSPENTDEDADDPEDMAGPKDMLSYSWRALRDSSLLLRALLNTSSNVLAEQRLTELSQIGDLCMEQLTMLRHRGAFSTVAQTFTLCCQGLLSIEGQGLVGVRLQWYQAAAAQIDQQADRLTRRSAGLPAMITGIMSPDDDLSFRKFIDSFVARSRIAEIDERSRKARLSLPQVHAMNTLREVMINSRFRNAIIPHIPKLLVLATENLGSYIWQIQNCGLMLYRACLLRLPKGDSAELHNVETLDHEKDISNALDLALDLLRPACQPEKHNNTGRSLDISSTRDNKLEKSLAGLEQNFAALDMIAHILPMNRSQPHLHAHLIKLLDSPIWLVRQRTAEVLSMLTPSEELLGDFEIVLNSIETEKRQDSLHGTLLYCRKLRQRYFSICPEALLAHNLPFFGQKLLGHLDRCSADLCAPPVLATLLDTINDVIEQAVIAKIPICPSLMRTELFFPDIVNLQSDYLVERSYQYNIALRLLISTTRHQNNDALLSMLRVRLLDDLDVARYILEKLLSQGLALRPQDLLQLDRLFSLDIAPYVLSATIEMVTLSTEVFSSDWDTALAQQFLVLLDPPAQTREIGASKMLAQARLFSLIEAHQDNGNALGTQMSLQHLLWEREVQYAARDDTDRHVRLQAAKAISAHIPHLLHANPVSNVFMIILTLRDLLNDDDEEVRSFAARTVSLFLSNCSGLSQSGTFLEGYCASTATALLEDYLRSVVTRRPVQHEILLRKLLDAEPENDLQVFFHEHTVEKQLSVINEEASMLFAVEKQNLYIDEVHEIYFWSSLCGLNNREHSVPFAGSAEAALGEWAVDGLGAIRTLLDVAQENPMLPGVTFNLDVLIVCVRVIAVAQAYLSFIERETETTSTYKTISDQLQDLKLLTSQVHVHPEVARSIDGSLVVFAK